MTKTDGRLSQSSREIPIRSIRVGKRHRKEIGDLTNLMQSIEEIGLLHPVVVTPNYRLIAGLRRLKACQKLQWEKVSVRIVDMEKIVAGEFAENVCRKDFTLSEIAAIAKTLRPVVEAQAKKRQLDGLKQGNGHPVGKNLPNGDNGKTRDIIARQVGISGVTLEKIESVVEAAEEDPERFGQFKERMDESGKVNKFYQQLRVARLMDESDPPPSNGNPTIQPNTIICGDCRDVLPKIPSKSINAVIFDPPWGINYEFGERRERNNDPDGYWSWLEPIYKETMRVLKPGGFWACWQSHIYFPYFWEWFGDDIRIFAACKDAG